MKADRKHAVAQERDAEPASTHRRPDDRGPRTQSLRGLGLADQLAALRPHTPRTADAAEASQAPQASHVPQEAQPLEAPRAPESSQTAQSTLAPGSPQAPQPPQASALDANGLSARFQDVTAFVQVMTGGKFLRPGCGDRAAVRVVQHALADLSIPCGPIDGIWGARTTSGVRTFQGNAGLAPDAVIGPLTLSALSAQTQSAPIPQDARLKHQDANASTGDPDATTAGWRDTDELPYAPDGVTWDGATILDRWSQIDSSGETQLDVHRCAAVAAMAPRILSGPGALSTFAMMVSGKSQVALARASTPPETRGRLLALAPGMAALQTKLMVGSVLPPGMRMTYGDLGILAETAMYAYAGDPTTGASRDEAREMVHAGTGEAKDARGRDKIPEHTEVANRTTMRNFLNRLAPGEAYQVHITTRERIDYNSDASPWAQLNHFVTVGRHPGAKGGGWYLYDPWPRQGSQMVPIKAQQADAESEEFWCYFEEKETLSGIQGLEPGFKTSIIVGSTRPES